MGDPVKKKLTPAQKAAYAKQMRDKAVARVKASESGKDRDSAMQDLRIADNAKIKMDRALKNASTFPDRAIDVISKKIPKGKVYR